MGFDHALTEMTTVSRTSWARHDADHVPPGAESVRHDLARAVGGQAVAVWAELVADGAERLQEGRCVDVHRCRTRARLRMGWWELSARLCRRMWLRGGSSAAPA
jgi:hypothetical protein